MFSYSFVNACVGAGNGAMAGSATQPKAPSLSPAKSDEELLATLLAKLGDLVLTHKEASGFDHRELRFVPVPKAKVGDHRKNMHSKVIINALKRAMQRAWGLHCPAQFKEIGDNQFVVRFGSKIDFKHVLTNGPWQFDQRPYSTRMRWKG
jgi:hypothetical protein